MDLICSDRFDERWPWKGKSDPWTAVVTYFSSHTGISPQSVERYMLSCGERGEPTDDAYTQGELHKWWEGGQGRVLIRKLWQEYPDVAKRMHGLPELTGPDAPGRGKSPASMILEVDPAAKLVRWNGKRVEINSHADFAVFSAVHSARGAIVSYLELLRAVKPDDVSDKIQSMPTAPPEVKEAVAHINAALKQVDCPNSFDNVRRQGYRLLSSDE